MNTTMNLSKYAKKVCTLRSLYNNRECYIRETTLKSYIKQGVFPIYMDDPFSLAGFEERVIDKILFSFSSILFYVDCNFKEVMPLCRLVKQSYNVNKYRLSFLANN